MDIKMTPKKPQRKEFKDDLLNSLIISPEAMAQIERRGKERRANSITTLYPEAAEMYAKHARFFKRIGVKSECIEEEIRPNMEMVFSIDKKITLSKDQLDEFLQIAQEQADTMEIVGKSNGTVQINYTMFDALNERRVKK